MPANPPHGQRFVVLLERELGGKIAAPERPRHLALCRLPIRPAECGRHRPETNSTSRPVVPLTSACDDGRPATYLLARLQVAASVSVRTPSTSLLHGIPRRHVSLRGLSRMIWPVIGGVQFLLAD